MKPSTKHALLQGLVALAGLALAFVPHWGMSLFGEYWRWVLVSGFVLGFIGVLSGAGIGPWGRHRTRLYIAEHRAEIGRPLKSYETGA